MRVPAEVASTHPIPHRTMSLSLELLHVFSVFLFVGGLLGRTVAQAQARRATDIRDLDAYLRISSQFENKMVRPGSFAVLGLGLLTAWLKHWPFAPLTWVSASLLLFFSAFLLVPTVFIPRGRLFRAALDDARGQGQVTPRLTAAMGDRIVAVGHAYEWAVVAAITWLMIAKPF
ncbi:DUF2269 family protein [Longimicrobium sp.]|uniref:DUF2269 family protein n=1 Tax=Longimicrobium sp. TaxID=2029185 RepID=UPI002C6BCD78|nr:DUF2269 family protein [Longimicrobium sp.]HSU17554.1 DUF2269 family protein [Longimicrobium sp.]